MDSTHTTKDIYSGATQELKEKAAKLRITTIVIICITLFAILVLILSNNAYNTLKEFNSPQAKNKNRNLN